jgi:hypothetical protein
MTVLAGVISVLLAVGGTVTPAGPAVPAWAPGDVGGPRIDMSVVNWGEDVDLAGPDTAYAHLGANGPLTHIKVNITPPSSGMHGYYGRLTAPDAFGGEVKLYCGVEYMRVDSVQRCFFDVPMSSGVNHLKFDLQSASWKGLVTQEGKVTAGRVGRVSVLEASLPYNNWALVGTDDFALRLRGEQTSALRYRIMNTGQIPFRVPDSCQPTGTVWPYQQLLCPVRGPRPVYALAGDYAVPIQLEDPFGGGAAFTIDGTLVVKNMQARPDPAGLERSTGTHDGAVEFHFGCPGCSGTG